VFAKAAAAVFGEPHQHLMAEPEVKEVVNLQQFAGDDCRVGITANHMRDRGGATGKAANQRAAATTLRATNETSDY